MKIARNYTEFNTLDLLPAIVETMRTMRIVLPKTTYATGENIAGHVIVKCDKEFRCKRITIIFRGKAETKMTELDYASSTRICHEIDRFYEQRKTLYSGGIINFGTTEFEFTINVPKTLVPTYHCKFGKITYELYAEMEVSRASNPKYEQPIEIVRLHKKWGDTSRAECIEKGRTPVFEVKTKETSFCYGENILLQIKISKQMNIRGVRIEFLHQEEIHAEGSTKREKQMLHEMFIERDDIPFDEWFDTKIRIGWDTPPVFHSRLIISSLMVKVTLDIPWRFDKSIEFPIIAGRCIEPKTTNDSTHGVSSSGIIGA